MTAPMLSVRVAVVNGSPSEPSRTAALAETAIETLRASLAADAISVDAERIDVYRLGSGFSGALDRDGIPPETEMLLRQVEQADLLIAAMPVFRGSYPGLFKHLFDLVDQYALANKPVLLLATGGGERHALVLEHALRPLFGFFQALTLPVAVFASAGDFDGTVLLNPRVHGRLQLAISDVRDLLICRGS